jgi:hypothetical protein
MVSERESRRDSFDGCPLGHKKNKEHKEHKGGTYPRMNDFFTGENRGNGGKALISCGLGLWALADGEEVLTAKGAKDAKVKT